MFGVVAICFQLCFGGSLSVCFPVTSDSQFWVIFQHKGTKAAFMESQRCEWLSLAWYQEVIPRFNLVTQNMLPRPVEAESAEEKNTSTVPYGSCGCFFSSLGYTKGFSFMASCIKNPALGILSVGKYVWGGTMANLLSFTFL